LEGRIKLVNRGITVFEHKRDEMTGGWRNLRDEELHNLYSSSVIIKMIKSLSGRWEGHVARTEGK
jgi:hypothetical protein